MTHALTTARQVPAVKLARYASLAPAAVIFGLNALRVVGALEPSTWLPLVTSGASLTYMAAVVTGASLSAARQHDS